MQMKPSAAVRRDRIGINIIPIVIAIVTFAIVRSNHVFSQNICSDAGISLCSTMMGVWATCLGFLITAVSILLALNNGTYIEMLRKTGHFQTILISFVSCCVHTLVALAIVIIITFMQVWSHLIFAILCASTVDVMIMMGICLYFLLVIVIKVNE